MVFESTLLTLVIILGAGLIIPEMFKKFRLPFITLLILTGSLLGPHGLGYVEIDEIIGFFGFMGMAFLMLMAGLETSIPDLKKFKFKIGLMVLLNALIPFLVGLFILLFFGYSLLTAVLIGIIFLSSSIAIVVPSLKSSGLLEHETGKMIISAIFVADVISLILLGIFLQTLEPITSFPLWFYIPLLIFSFAILFAFFPGLSKFTLKKSFGSREEETQFRFLLVIVLGCLIYFSWLGVHPILATFITGLLFSSIIKKDSSQLYIKLKTIGYGLFIPIFFFIIGTELDLSLFRYFDINNLLMISLIFGFIISKFGSSYLGGKLVKMTKKDSLIFAGASIIQLTTTLAVTYAAASLGFIDSVIVTSIILLSIITTFFGPIFITYINKKL